MRGRRDNDRDREKRERLVKYEKIVQAKDIGNVPDG